MSLMIKVMPASNGDSIIIRFGNNKNNLSNILIDGGRGLPCFKALKSFFIEVNNKKQDIDLVVTTHVDDDHINGILKIFQDKTINKKIIKDTWFNSGKLLSKFFKTEETGNSNEISISLLDSTDMSISQGISLEKYLNDLGIWSKKILKSTDCYECSGAIIRIVSPNINVLSQLNKKWELEISNNTDMSFTSDYDIPIEELLKNRYVEDKSMPNKSSIGFIFEYNNMSLLMLGDSHPSVVIESLRQLGYSEKNKLKVDLTKISHHGSKSNTSDELLNLVECNKFIISTDGSQHGLPNKECLARIINHVGSNAMFYFNYNIVDRIFKKSEIDKLGLKYKCLSPDEYIILEE